MAAVTQQQEHYSELTRRFLDSVVNIDARKSKSLRILPYKLHHEIVLLYLSLCCNDDSVRLANCDRKDPGSIPALAMRRCVFENDISQIFSIGTKQSTRCGGQA